MATLTDILQWKYPGAEWSIQGQDYATLVWAPTNTLTKPTLTELQGFSAEVDGLIAQAMRQDRQRERLLETDRLLVALSALTDALVDVRGKLRSTALSSALDGQITTRLNSIKTRIDEIKNAP